MSLASRLPYDHPFAGGYPSLGSQPLPTDSDCLTYLANVASADGSGVEVGVAMALDAFFRDLKATPGLFDAIKASCILCGARTITGALVPLAGTAPTPYNFASGDYSRTTGLKGDGATKYLDTNRAGNADGQNDAHIAVYKTDTALASGYIAGRYTSAGTLAGISRSGSNPRFWVNDAVGYTPSTGDAAIAGFFAASRNSPSQIAWKSPTSGDTGAASSTGVSAWTTNIFATTSGSNGSPAGYSDARLAFYSIGSSLDLAALDNRVSTLVASIAAAI